MNAAVDQLSQAQRERLAFLEMRAYFTGELRRADIEARFGIKPAASSRDLSAYRDLEPSNLDYDVAARCYRPSKAFKPIFEFSSERVLAWLLQGFGDGLELKLRKAAPCEGPGNLVRPDLAILSTVTRAMCARRAIKVSYLSMSSGAANRELVPVALADNGLRWHVRAYCEKHKDYRDFVLSRFRGVPDFNGESEFTATQDSEWNSQVTIRLQPDTRLSIAQQQIIAHDYGMINQELAVTTKAPLVGYLLQAFNIDHRKLEISPTAQQIVIGNYDEIKGYLF